MTTTLPSAAPQDGVAGQHAALGMRPEGIVSSRPTHPEAQWFGTAGLGLMVHWGLPAVHGNLETSWSMIANTPWDAAGAPGNKITPAEYWKLAADFRPENFAPNDWIAAAARAGFRYAVFVAMHHDGYTMWPSRSSRFGVQSTPVGRDLVGPYVEACRRAGIKVGLYLSPPDWHFDRKHMSFNYRSMGGLEGNRKDPTVPMFDEHHRPAVIAPPSADHLAERRQLFHARIRELLTDYGRIDLLWFDGGTWDNDARDLALSIQPHLVINSRICAGHFESTECGFPAEPPVTWMETCYCWQTCDLLMPNGAPVEVWGYLDRETYKPARWVADAYRKLRNWNVNFLLNVSPRPDGTMPPIVYQRFQELQKELA
ncbi:MAG TPA: alpha-L-fucosidase [Terrimicrobiaceae bacterium]|nr:alpha-L-fucosidase [Terrimicrobiaceae bacterium]